MGRKRWAAKREGRAIEKEAKKIEQGRKMRGIEEGKEGEGRRGRQKREEERRGVEDGKEKIEREEKGKGN